MTGLQCQNVDPVSCERMEGTKFQGHVYLAIDNSCHLD